jgi:hypothetical protein
MGRIAMGTLLDDFLQIHAITGDIIFFMGLLIAFNIQQETKRLFGATVEEKTRAWWHQVHKKGLPTLQTSAWDVWSVASSVKTPT